VSEVLAKPTAGIFLDRDGTIIEDTGYIRRAEDVRLLPEAAEGLRNLQEHGFRLIVVTNQSGLARGIFGIQEMETVKARFCELLEQEGIRLTDYLYCPHHPEGTVEEYRKVCTCRKGAPGMILTGAHRHNIELDNSWMIGDKDDDVQAGFRAGVRTIRIGTGTGNYNPDYQAKSLLHASRIILQGK